MRIHRHIATLAATERVWQASNDGMLTKLMRRS